MGKKYKKEKGRILQIDLKVTDITFKKIYSKMETLPQHPFHTRKQPPHFCFLTIDGGLPVSETMMALQYPRCALQYPATAVL